MTLSAPPSPPRSAATSLHVLVHDDDVFAYWFWRGGQLADSYFDPPGYFNEADAADQEGMSGNPQALRHLLAPRKKVEDVAALLRRGRGDFVMQVERLTRFAKLLGIANAATSYEYLKEGDRTGVRGWKQFEEVPADQVKDARAAGRERRKQINALKKRLKQSGVLLAEVTEDRAMPRCAAAGRDGFVLAWHGFAGSNPPLQLHRSPWAVATTVATLEGAQVNVLASDVNGGRLAAALGNRVAVYDTATWRPLADLPERDWSIGVALSPNGALLAHASRQEVVVTRLGAGPGGESRVAAVTGPQRRHLALHPSSRWLVGASELALGLLDLPSPSPAWHDLFVGGRTQPPAAVVDAAREHFSTIDLDAVAKKLPESMEQTLKMMERGMKRLSPEARARKLAELRSAMEQQLKATLAQLAEARAGKWEQPARGNERPACVGIIADGRWLWCGTDHGLRVYEWDAVAAATGDAMPPPRFAYADRALTGHENYIYAVAEEPAGGGIVFVGLAGKVYRMDLTSGEVIPLLSAPDKEMVFDLKLSADGVALAVCTQPHPAGRRGKKAMHCAWTVWSYHALRAGATVS